MEFRRNIIFSVIAHASIVLMILSLAGRNAALSHLAEDCIVVSLLEDTKEKGPAQGGSIENRLVRKDPETKLPLQDSDERTPSHNEKVAPVQHTKDDPPDERKTLKDVRNPDAERGQTPEKAPGLSSPIQEGLGYTKSPVNTSSASRFTGQTAVSGSGMEVTITGSRPAGERISSPTAADMIRAAIERAKVYPTMARKRGQQGVVVAEFSISGRGQPEHIRVVKGSGFEILDTAAKDAISRAAPFPVVRGTMAVPIRFTLKQQDSFDVK